MTLRKEEARRDYYTGVIKEFHFKQFDSKPNHDLKEAKCEVYKLTISESFQCYNDTPVIGPYANNHRCNHRVLCQNEEGNMNMGACYSDPVLDVYDIHWFSVLELEMEASLMKNEGLITVDEEFNTKSCYVELHRNRVSNYSSL